MTRCDLHIHSALSACGENTMSPRRILERAHAAGLNLVALTDHNASEHVELFCRLADDFGMKAIPALEVTSREEVHALAYFSDLERLRKFQQMLDDSMPPLENNADFFGDQVVYDERDEIVGLDTRLRQIGSALGLAGLVYEVHRLAGIIVPAHVFRGRYSLTSQLGFIDGETGFDAVEITAKEWRRRRLRVGARENGLPVVAGSDSHFLEDIGRFHLELEGEVRSLKELVGALSA